MFNFLVLFAERSSTLILSLLTTVVIARFMGPSESGLFQTCVSITFLFKYLCSFGAQHIITSDVAKSHMNISKIYSALRLYNLGFVIYFSLVYSFLYLLDYRIDFYYILSILNLGVFFERSIFFQSIGHGVGDYKSYSYSSLIGSLVSFLYIVSCMIFGADIFFVSFYYPIQTFVTYVLIRNRIYKNNYALEKKSTDVVWRESIDLFKRSYPLLLSGALYTIYMRADMIVVERMLGEEIAGLYSAAAKLVMPMAFIGTVFSQLYFKNIVDLWSKKELLEVLLIKVLAIANYTALFLFFIYVIFSGKIINLVYGYDYISSKTSLAIFSFSFFVIFSSSIFSRILVVGGFYKIELYKTGIAALINGSLLLTLIPLFGMDGAAIATVVAFTFSDLIMYSLFKETRFVFISYLRSFTWWRYAQVRNNSSSISE